MGTGGYEKFLNCIIRGNKNEVKIHFKPEYLERRNEQLMTPVLLATRCGHSDIVHFFYEKYCNMEACDKSGWRSIHFTCEKGHLEIARFLCGIRCNINAYTKESLRPIHYACQNGHFDVVELLINNKCNIESVDKHGWRPIHYACSKGHFNIVKLLIGSGCDIEACNKYNERPIHFASGKGNLEILKLLCEHQCDLEPCDNDGWRPIHHSCYHGCIDVFKFLYENQCNMEACDKDESRPIHHACKKGHIKIVKLLFENKCNMEASDKNGWRPIHYASHYGYLDIVEFLYRNRINAESCDKNGLRPIHHGSSENYTEIVQFLCQNQCIMEASDKTGCRPIHHSCQKGHVVMVGLLIANNCSIEACDKNGWRPIHHACYYGHGEVMKLLCENNCNIKVYDKNNKSPIDMAKENGYHAIIDLINIELEQRKMKRISLLMKSECDLDCDHHFCIEALSSPNFKSANLIHSGTFGQVYKFAESETDLELIIKSVKIGENYVGNDAKYVEQEINKYQELDKHKYVVQCFGIRIKSQEMYIFMEYMTGGSLFNLIKNSGPLPHSRIIQYCEQILQGLQFLHGNKVIHGDIKPRNILLDLDENVKLGVLGLISELGTVYKQSRSNDNSDSQNKNLNAYYMAPEVINGKRYGFASDIWSFGATVVEMLTGKPPYSELIPNAAMFKVSTTKKIIFQPSEPMSKNMILFIKQIFNPIPSGRATAQALLQFISENNLVKS